MARSISDLHIQRIETLIPPEDLQRKLPMSQAIAQTVSDGRDQVQDMSCPAPTRDSSSSSARAPYTTRRPRSNTQAV